MVLNRLDIDLENIENHSIFQARAVFHNNAVTRRMEQLRNWEDSELNQISPKRKPLGQCRVKFQERDIFLSACASGDEDEVEYLLDRGSDINASSIDGVTALHQAVIDGKIDVVRFLLDHGAEINIVDSEGWTPLHAAVCCGNFAMIKFLTENGADLSAVNVDSEMAVDLTEDDKIRSYLEEELRHRGINEEECKEREFNKMLEDCSLWIKTGRYSDMPHPRTGATALHVSASKGYNKLIGMLIRAGANVHAQDLEGWTPLHAAAHWAEKDACRILMENGASLDAKTFQGQDVLLVADKSIIDYLQELQKQFAELRSDALVVQQQKQITGACMGSTTSKIDGQQQMQQQQPQVKRQRLTRESEQGGVEHYDNSSDNPISISTTSASVAVHGFENDAVFVENNSIKKQQRLMGEDHDEEEEATTSASSNTSTATANSTLSASSSSSRGSNGTTLSHFSSSSAAGVATANRSTGPAPQTTPSARRFSTSLNATTERRSRSSSASTTTNNNSREQSSYSSSDYSSSSSSKTTSTTTNTVGSCSSRREGEGGSKASSSLHSSDQDVECTLRVAPNTVLTASTNAKQQQAQKFHLNLQNNSNDCLAARSGPPKQTTRSAPPVPPKSVACQPIIASHQSSSLSFDHTKMKPQQQFKQQQTQRTGAEETLPPQRKTSAPERPAKFPTTFFESIGDFGGNASRTSAGRTPPLSPSTGGLPLSSAPPTALSSSTVCPTTTSNNGAGARLFWTTAARVSTDSNSSSNTIATFNTGIAKVCNNAQQQKVLQRSRDKFLITSSAASTTPNPTTAANNTAGSHSQTSTTIATSSLSTNSSGKDGTSNNSNHNSHGDLRLVPDPTEPIATSVLPSPPSLLYKENNDNNKSSLFGSFSASSQSVKKSSSGSSRKPVLSDNSSSQVSFAPPLPVVPLPQFTTPLAEPTALATKTSSTCANTQQDRSSTDIDSNPQRHQQQQNPTSPKTSNKSSGGASVGAIGTFFNSLTKRNPPPPLSVLRSIPSTSTASSNSVSSAVSSSTSSIKSANVDIKRTNKTPVIGATSFDASRSSNRKSIINTHVATDGPPLQIHSAVAAGTETATTTTTKTAIIPAGPSVILPRAPLARISCSPTASESNSSNSELDHQQHHALGLRNQNREMSPPPSPPSAVQFQRQGSDQILSIWQKKNNADDIPQNNDSSMNPSKIFVLPRPLSSTSSSSTATTITAAAAGLTKNTSNSSLITTAQTITPPTQPTSQKESEAERKAKSRLKRQSRRSTQGVTQEQLNEINANHHHHNSYNNQQHIQQQLNLIRANSKLYDDDPSASDQQQHQANHHHHYENSDSFIPIPQKQKIHYNDQLGRRDKINSSATFDPNSSVLAELARYKTLYEQERFENERLRFRLQESMRNNQKDIKQCQNCSNTTQQQMCNDERTSYEHRIQELEARFEKTTYLRLENEKLKEENVALIRVLTKLSKK